MKKFLASLLIIAYFYSAQAQTNKYLTGIGANHYVSGVDTNLGQQISRTNNDSAFYANIGHVGTKGDSIGDTTFFLYNLTPTLGGVVSMGVQPDFASDTLCDSILVYENHILLARLKVPNGPLNFAFTLTPSSNSFVSRPEQFAIKTKWKLKSGKLAHMLRIRPNFITGQQ